MRKVWVKVLAATAALAAFSTSASAQSCKAEVVVATGRASLTEGGARRNAIESWRREVLYRYGESWAEFERARDANVERCAHTSLGILLRCEARGQPCDVPLTASSPVFVFTPVPCRSSDSKACDPYVKAMQLKLTAKGCRTTADGAAGPSTANALRCFQRKASLPVTGNLDLETARALNN